MFNLLNGAIRTQILAESKLQENVDRKSVSFGQYEIYKDRILQQVKKYLEGFYSKATMDNTPIVASVNLARRIVNKEASIYCKKPTRKFQNMSDEQIKLIEQVYKDMKMDSLMKKLNKNFKLQDQAHAYIVPKKGKLKASTLLSHQFDVVPSSLDQEDGEVYLINGFDRMAANVKVTNSGDNLNEMIADENDYQAGRKAIAWWSPLFNFITNENGGIISTETDNPLKGVLPFVDINAGKDGEYWVRTGAALTDFTIQFNAGLTDLGNIVRMQGFGQAWMKAPKGMMPENIQVGPNFIIKMTTDPDSDAETDFGYANANPDLAGSLSYLEGLLSSFLTSRGVDPKVVNTKGDATKFASGLERLLSMIEQFEATEDDLELFVEAENQILKIVIKYIETYGGSETLPKYPKTIFNPEASVIMEFQKPTSIQTESEKLDVIQKRKDMELISQIEAIMEDRDITFDEAKKVFNDIQDQNKEFMSSVMAIAQNPPPKQNVPTQ